MKWYFTFTNNEKSEFQKEFPERLHSDISAQKLFTEHIKMRKPYRKFRRVI